MVSKRSIVRQVCRQLGEELDSITGASRAMHADASDDQNKAEDKYDTRGLETAYLASSQARLATKTEQALAAFQALTLRKFDADTPIDVSAMVELESNGDHALYLIGPQGGGTEVHYQDLEIFVITPESPLGAQLIGKKNGDRVKLQTRGPAQEFRITDVW